MRHLLVLLALVAALAACSPTAPDPGQMETAVAATVAAMPPPTAAATATPESTATPAATATPEVPLPCAFEYYNEYFKAYTDIHGRWLDTKAIADNTMRMNLGDVVADLQSLRRELDLLYPPPCGVTLHQTMMDHMQLYIDACLYLMGMANSPTSKQLATQADEKLIDVNNLLGQLSEEIADYKATTTPQP